MQKQRQTGCKQMKSVNKISLAPNFSAKNVFSFSLEMSYGVQAPAIFKQTLPNLNKAHWMPIMPLLKDQEARTDKKFILRSKASKSGNLFSADNPTCRSGKGDF